MKTDVNEALDYEPIHIGKLIEEELHRQERTVTWLSRKIHCDRRNVYKIFARPYIDTDLLMRLCNILHTDFFAYFSFNLHHINIQSLTQPIQFATPSTQQIQNGSTTHSLTNYNTN